MSIGGALAIASSGLASINAQLALVSQNVANASTPGYALETASLQSLTAGGQGMGVVTGQAGRATDAALQGSLLLQNAVVAGLTARQSALAGIDAVQGTPGQGGDLGSLLGKLQDGLATLAGAPDNPTQQAAVVAAAQRLAAGINALSAAYGAARQTAQDGIVADVGTANATLGTIGSLSDQIIAARAAGRSSADLEGQRDAAVQTLSSLVDVKVLQQPNGDVLLTTANGLTLPTRGATNPLSAAPATLGPGAYAPGGGVPAVLLGGADVTRSLSGGRIGTELALRDATLPGYQAQLDEFSQNLASRFDAQGLRLFSDPAGAVPAGGGVPVQAGYVGFAGSIQVSPAVSADPALVRDGTHTVAGSPTGAAAFTPNPAGGPAGFTTLIARVLDFALGAQAQAGVPQPGGNVTGLGPDGSLSAPYAAPATPAGFAAALTGAEAQDSAAAGGQATGAQALQSSLQSRLASETGVSIDTEMSLMVRLQNAYGANAKVIAAVQAMWTQLLTTVP